MDVELQQTYLYKDPVKKKEYLVTITRIHKNENMIHLTGAEDAGYVRNPDGTFSIFLSVFKSLIEDGTAKLVGEAE